MINTIKIIWTFTQLQIFLVLSGGTISHALPPVPIPQTGQTICYNSAGTAISCAGTGQDGELNNGMPWSTPRFTDLGNGTVADNLTGLMWTKNANAPGPAACTPAVAKTWQDALGYTACLNTYSYLGYADWRVPSIRELGGLVDTSRSNPVLPSGHPFSSVQSSFYWSGSTSVGSTALAWSVGMSNGDIGITGKTSNVYVWPVRSGQ